MTQPIPDQPDLPAGSPAAKADDFVTAAGALLATDAIEKIDAGAALVHALYHLPIEKVSALLHDATRGFADTWVRAQAAYAVGRSR